MSDDYDSHSRTATRTARIRRISQRPSEVNDTRPGNKGSAYCKSRGEAKCNCGRMFYLDMMVGGLCMECVMKKGATP